MTSRSSLITTTSPQAIRTKTPRRSAARRSRWFQRELPPVVLAIFRPPRPRERGRRAPGARLLAAPHRRRASRRLLPRHLGQRRSRGLRSRLPPSRGPRSQGLPSRGPGPRLQRRRPLGPPLRHPPSQALRQRRPRPQSRRPLPQRSRSRRPRPSPRGPSSASRWRSSCLSSSTKTTICLLASTSVRRPPGPLHRGLLPRRPLAPRAQRRPLDRLQLHRPRRPGRQRQPPRPLGHRAPHHRRPRQRPRPPRRPRHQHQRLLHPPLHRLQRRRPALRRRQLAPAVRRQPSAPSGPQPQQQHGPRRPRPGPRPAPARRQRT
jgi:hypothetical protein